MRSVIMQLEKRCLVAILSLGGKALFRKFIEYIQERSRIDRGIPINRAGDIYDIDHRISQFSVDYLLSTADLLRELIAFPKTLQSANPCVLIEKFRDLLTQKIIDYGASLSSDSIKVDSQGNLVWHISDPKDDTPIEKKRVIFVCSTFSSLLRSDYDWTASSISGLDPRCGLVNQDLIREELLHNTVDGIPSKEWWKHLTFGIGACSGLQGIAVQIMAMKILIETIPLGSLRGVFVVGSISHNRHSPSYFYEGKSIYPDAIILSEASGSLQHGPCGIHIGQRGLTRIDVSIGCPNSSRVYEKCQLITAQAADIAKNGFKSHTFLGPGDRRGVIFESSKGQYGVRFDRSLSCGETGSQALEEISRLPQIRSLKGEGFSTSVIREDVSLPWMTPRDNPATLSVIDSYRRTVSPWNEDSESNNDIRRRAWIGAHKVMSNKLPFPAESGGVISLHKKEFWVQESGFVSPPIVAIGAGFEENEGQVGEYVHNQHLQVPIAVISRFPSLFRFEI